MHKHVVWGFAQIAPAFRFVQGLTVCVLLQDEASFTINLMSAQDQLQLTDFETMLYPWQVGCSTVSMSVDACT